MLYAGLSVEDSWPEEHEGKTKKHATALLVYLQEKQGHKLPTAGEFYKLAENVRDTFKASEQAPAVGSYNKYPMAPQELGQDTERVNVHLFDCLSL